MPRILIAEDDPDVRSFLEDELTNAGFTVTAVDNGADAVVAAVEQPFDLYLLDMLMPGLDGIQTIRVLKKLTPDVPIIGLTGYVGLGYMAQAAAYGVICLAKPVVMADLIREINEAIASRSGGEEADI
ncbi:MAG: response regulator [Anaerolineae bacterium]|nr:response regulator [Anaerolineae bacterium]MDW8071646.1 response regulator [Anaerolineae bacterium]